MQDDKKENQENKIQSNSDPIKSQPNPSTTASLRKSSREVSSAIFFSFIRSYGAIPLQLLFQILISRFISESLWGIFIYCSTIILGARTFLIFIPPSIETVLYIKIPELVVQNKYSQVKGLIHYTIKVKIIACLLTGIGYSILAIGLLVKDFNSIHAWIILILVPFIFFNEIRFILYNLLNAMKKFRLSVIYFFISEFMLLFGYIFLFLVPWSEITKVYALACLTTLNSFLNCPFLLLIYFKHVKRHETAKVRWQDIKETARLGTIFSALSSISSGYEQIYINSLEFYGSEENITSNNICFTLTRNVLNAISIPIIPILSELEKTNQRAKMMKLFSYSYFFTNIILSFIMGLAFFLIKPYIYILFPPEYINTIEIAQIYVFIIFFINVNSYYSALFTVINKEKYILYGRIVSYSILSLFAFIGMYFFGFRGLIYFRILGFFIDTLIYYLQGRNLKKEFSISFLFLYRRFIEVVLLIYATEIIVNLLLSTIPLTDIITPFANCLIELFKKNFDFVNNIAVFIESVVKMILFIVLYTVYIRIFRIITQEDIDKIEQINLKIPAKYIVFKILRKILLKQKNPVPIERI